MDYRSAINIASKKTIIKVEFHLHCFIRSRVALSLENFRLLIRCKAWSIVFAVIRQFVDLDYH